MRARNIKPGLFKNEDLAGLPIWIRYFFTGLWCYADRQGCFEIRPKRIKVEIFPYDDDINGDKICGGLATLVESAFIQIYKSDNKYPIGKIIKFTDHQRPHYNEKASIYKDFIKSCNLGDKHLLPRTQALAPDIIIDDIIIDDIIIEDIRNEDIQKKYCDLTFHEFWTQYPKKDKKIQAEKIWLRINPNKKLFGDIMSGLAKAKMTKQWNTDGGQFIPLPSTWLNAKQWLDEGVQSDYANTSSDKPLSRHDENMEVAKRMLSQSKGDDINGEFPNSQRVLSNASHNFTGQKNK